MTQLYVRSTDGLDSDAGTTWALAKATLAGVTAIDAVGDTINLSQAHSETTAGVVSINCAGTPANPTKILCVSDAAEPPNTLATTALVTNTGSAAINLNGSLYCYGVQYVGAAAINVGAGGVNCVQLYEACAFRLTNPGSGGQLFFSQDNDATRVVLSNCTYKFAASANYISLGQNVALRGGSVEAGTTTPVALFKLPGDRTQCRATIEGVDFSNLAAGVVLFSNTGMSAALTTMRNCKLPAGWSGTLMSAAVSAPGQRFEMFNCAGAGVNVALWIEDYSGSIRHETTVVKTGGASDGTTSLAWKMASSATATYPAMPLYSPEIAQWNDVVGTAKTATVDILHDSVTALNNDEVWLEVQYLSASGAPLGTFITNAKADVMAAAAAQTASTATWTTTGLTNPNKQKLSVTFTPQMKGFILAKVMLAKPSKTIYVDPLLQVV